VSVNERGEGRLIRCTDEGGKAIAIGWGHTHRFQPYNNAGGAICDRNFPFLSVSRKTCNEQ
jgi:hypothetical protein